MILPTVRALVTGTPPHRATQAELRAAAQQLFPRLSSRATLLGVFDNAEIDQRFLAREPEWYFTPRGFAEKNAVYTEVSLELLERLGRAALQQAGVSPGQVDAVVLVSSTGISTPSLDSYLIQRLGLSPHAARVPLWGLGCAGGASGLARAADLVRAGFKNVLLLVVELCSITFVRGDESQSNFVGSALFADGGAAALLGPDAGEALDGHEALCRVPGAYSTLIPDSADIMGWDVVDAGLQVRFSRDIPTLVRQMMAQNVQEALSAHGWDRSELSQFVVHPGGAKVLAAYQEALGLDPAALDASRQVLRCYGNMSSATVLFVLAEILKGKPQGRGLLSAMGPGFCAEHVLLEF